MKNQIINEIQRKMLPYLNNEQLLYLKMVLETSFQGLILEKSEELSKVEEQNAVKAFITAKRIEGCSEKTLTYYSKTISLDLLAILSALYCLCEAIRSLSRVKFPKVRYRKSVLLALAGQ